MKNKSDTWAGFVRNKFAGVALTASALLGVNGCRMAPPPETPKLTIPHVHETYVARQKKCYDEMDAAVNPAADEMAALIKNISAGEKAKLMMKMEDITVSVYPPHNDFKSQVVYKIGNGDEASLPACANLLDKYFATINLFYEMKWDGLNPIAPDYQDIADKMAKRMHGAIPFVTDEDMKQTVSDMIIDVVSRAKFYSVNSPPARLQDKADAAFRDAFMRFKDRELDAYGVITPAGIDLLYPEMKCQLADDAHDSTLDVKLIAARQELYDELAKTPSLTPFQQALLDKSRECNKALKEETDNTQFTYPTGTTLNANVTIFNPRIYIRPTRAGGLNANSSQSTTRGR